jgi:hypothetical protein
MNKTKISMQIRRTLNLLAPPAILPARTVLARCGISSEIEAAPGTVSNSILRSALEPAIHRHRV